MKKKAKSKKCNGNHPSPLSHIEIIFEQIQYLQTIFGIKAQLHFPDDKELMQASICFDMAIKR